MIKPIFLILALCLAAAAQCFADSPHMGTWKLNEAKSKFGPGMARNGTVTYTAEGDKIKVTIDGTDKDGKPTHSVWVGKFDGKPYPAEGGSMGNANVAYTVVDDHTNNVTATKDGQTLFTGVIKVSADGKSRTVTVQSKDASGKEMTTEAVYDKQ